jgi:hypothetical protein
MKSTTDPLSQASPRKSRSTTFPIAPPINIAVPTKPIVVDALRRLNQSQTATPIANSPINRPKPCPLENAIPELKTKLNLNVQKISIVRPLFREFNAQCFVT